MSLRQKQVADATKDSETPSTTVATVVGHNPSKPIYVLCGLEHSDKLSVVDLERAGT
jgi:hypothetical protein